jgi:hypothetical protein
MMLIDELLEHLQKIGSDPHRNGKGWVALCPAHDDRQSSLLIRQADDGMLSLECSAGCSLDSIINAISTSHTTAPRNEPLHKDSAPPKEKAGRRETYGFNDLYHARKIVEIHGNSGDIIEWR